MAVTVDDFFQRLSAWYDCNLRRAMRRPWLVIGGTLAATAIAALLLKVLPSELAPVEDRGFLFIGMNGPEGSSLEYMDRHVRILEGMAAKQMETGDVQRVNTRVPGGFGGSGSQVNEHVASCYGAWGERSAADQIAQSLRDRSTPCRACAAS
jgi:multidrug efflux pump